MTTKETSTKITANHLAGRRARFSLDRGDEPTFSTPFFVERPADPLNEWRLRGLDEKTLDRVSPARLMELLADLSPEVSRALWDFLRFCNPGYEAKAMRPGSDDQDDAATQALTAMLDELSDLYGAADIQINRLFLSAFMRGAILSELVLDENSREFVDLAVPDPYYMRFRRVTHPIRGQIWEMGQYQGGEWVSFADVETIRYMPIDPLPGVPYGRSLISPAVFSVLFLIGLLHDLRRVVAQQGYPRINISVNLEKLAEAMPPDLEGDPDATEQWVNAIIKEVCDIYAALEPDDAYVHTDVVEVNTPVGTMGVGTGSMQFVAALIATLERMAIRGLKSMPLLMASNEGTTETLANRQWEVHAAGIKSIQHLVETLLERLFGLALQAQGIAATVQFRFAELRASEMLRDAQVETMQIANEGTKYDRGWISQDQASEAITGSAADAPEPRVVTTGNAPDISTNLPEESDSRRLITEIREAKQTLGNALMNGHKDATRNGHESEYAA